VSDVLKNQVVVLGIFQNHERYWNALARLNIGIAEDAINGYPEIEFEQVQRAITISTVSVAELGLYEKTPTTSRVLIALVEKIPNAKKCPPETAVAIMQQHGSKFHLGARFVLYMDPVDNTHKGKVFYQIGAGEFFQSVIAPVSALDVRKWRPDDILVYDTGMDVPLESQNQTKGEVSNA
jgi:hypothetical protein